MGCTQTKQTKDVQEPGKKPISSQPTNQPKYGSGGYSSALPIKGNLITQKESNDYDIKEVNNELNEILDACFQGNLDLVKGLIRKYSVKDIVNIKGYSQQIHITAGTKDKKYQFLEEWNPLLLAIAKKHTAVVKLIFKQVPQFHYLNALSKPYTLEEQKEKIFHQNKRIKRESFSLKLSILNKDEQTFKYLWNELRILWNLSHFILCFEYMIRSKWAQGVSMLFKSTTTKVIFMSINDVDNFIEAVVRMNKSFTDMSQIFPEIVNQAKTAMFIRPYFLFGMFMQIAATTKADRDNLIACMQQVTEEDVQFYKTEIQQIFDKLDIGNQYTKIRDRFFVQFKGDKDVVTKDNLNRLRRMLSDPNQEDDKGQISLLDDLDLFAFRNFNTPKDGQTNALIEILSRGLINLIHYAFKEGFINVRSTLRIENRFEFQNELKPMFINYFFFHQQSFETFKTIYDKLIDILALSNFCELFDKITSPDIFIYILNDIKFKSMFDSSLEMQKYFFVEVATNKCEESKELMEILNQSPYEKYQEDIKNKNIGKEYFRKTIKYIRNQEKEKNSSQEIMMQKRMSNRQHSDDTSTTPIPQQWHPNNERNQDSYTLSVENKKDIESKFSFAQKFPEGESQRVRSGFIDQSQDNHEELKEGSEQSVPTPVNKDKKKLTPRGKSLPKMDSQEQERLEQLELEFQRKQDQQDLQEQQQKEHQRQEEERLQSQQKKPQQVQVLDYSLQNQTKESQKRIIQESMQKESQYRESINDQALSKMDLKNQSIMRDSQQPRNTSIMNPNKSMRYLNNDDQDNHPLEEADGGRKINQGIQPNKKDFQQSSYLEPIDTFASFSIFQFQQLPKLFQQAIADNNIVQVKQLVQRFSIKSVTWIKNIESEQLRVKLNEILPNGSSQKAQSNTENQNYYDTTLWNPILFSIYYQRVDIAKYLLDNLSQNFVLSIRLPPPSEFSEYIIPGQKSNPNQQWQNNKLNDSQSNDPYALSPARGYNQQNYNPSDARVECFGLELAIRNKDLTMLKYLWSDQKGKWEERHFAFVFDRILLEHYDLGLGVIFRSKTSNIIFKGLNPEDKDNFLCSKIMDKVTEEEYWMNNGSPMKITPKQLEIVIQELSYDPYGSYAVLKFPNYFDQFNLLDQTLMRVNSDDIYEFVTARKENLQHFEAFAKQYEKKHGKSNKKLQEIIDLARKVQPKKIPINPLKIVQFIKLGDVTPLRAYFEAEDNYLLLELLNQLQGYEDDDYIKLFDTHVKYRPVDDTMNILLGDNTTIDWNPLIFAIFYQKLDIVQYFCDHPSVYVRNCLTTPFIIETDEDIECEDDEKFIKEKTEVFALVLSIMLQNKDIFRYLWNKVTYLWNDIHLILLANYVFEAQWNEGVKILFGSTHTHAIFNSMNMFEKEKFLKFADKSASKIPPVIKEFRYRMSFDPYNVFYLPILASPEELQLWDKEMTKEYFFQNCKLNFDKKSYSILNKVNNHYISEFISTAPASESENVKTFAKLLRRFATKNDD